jgi:RNA polymerase sigma-70 factor (ECF subfamily)
MAADDFAEFYQGTWRRIVTFVYAMSGDLAEAEDLAQEAYARTWSRWSTVRGYADPESWVRTVAYRLFISRWRKMRNRLAAYRRHGPADPADPPSEDTVALVAALRELPDVQRHAIVLHHLLDLPVAEIARQTGTSENTVKARLVRGRRAIAKELGTEFPVEVTNA